VTAPRFTAPFNIAKRPRVKAAAVLALIFLLANPLNSTAYASGIKARTSDGGTLPGAVTFTPRTPKGKASSVISAASSRSSEGRLISYFPKHVQTEIRDLLPADCPEHAMSLRGSAEFVIKKYEKSVGSISVLVETGKEASKSYHYVGLVGVIENGGVDWYTLRAKIYNAGNGVLSVTLGPSLCAAVSREGRSAVILIIGESYRWW
jgi:hypothetical protein